METLRDIVIIIAGILFIILVLGMAIGGFVAYRKVKKTIADMKRRFRTVTVIIHTIRVVREIFRKSKARAQKA